MADCTVVREARHTSSYNTRDDFSSTRGAEVLRMIKETQKGLQCCSERHLLRSALAMAIYSKIGAITYGGRDGGKYFGTLETLADLFGCAPNSVWRAIKWLVKAGFLERIETTDGSEYQLRAVCFQSKEYRYVSHEEWAGKHPGQCYQALAVPWDCLGED